MLHVIPLSVISTNSSGTPNVLGINASVESSFEETWPGFRYHLHHLQVSLTKACSLLKTQVSSSVKWAPKACKGFLVSALEDDS